MSCPAIALIVMLKALAIYTVRTKHGDVDQAVYHGLAAFGYDRKTEASLLSHAVDLDRILTERYPRERLTSDFHERYTEARANLRQRAHSSG